MNYARRVLNRLATQQPPPPTGKSDPAGTLSAVESTLAPADGGKVRISVRIDEHEVDRAMDAAFRRIARQVRLPGFRPGKAPRKVLEARLGSDYIRAEALQDTLGDYYQQAVVRHEVDVIAPPDIDITAGQTDGPVAFDAVVEVRPTVNVDGYDALAVEVPSPLPTDEEVSSQIDAVRAQFADLETVNRPAIDSDHVTIDVHGSHDGTEVEGLTVADYTYEVGSGAVVPEIDENLRGARAGDILEFNADHPDPDTEGLLRFRVLVKEVQARRLPDLDDDLVRSVSEFDTVAELRGDIVGRLSDAKGMQVRMLLRERISEALAQLVVAEIPEALVVAEIDRRLNDLQQALQRQDGDLNRYLAATGQTEEQLREQMRAPAEQNVRLDLGLRAVADAETLDVDAAELAGDAERTAERMDLDPAEVRSRLDRSGGWSALRAERRKEMAFDWLMDNVTVTDPDGVPIAAELLAPPEPAPGLDDDLDDDFDDDFDPDLDLDPALESAPEDLPQATAEAVSSTGDAARSQGTEASPASGVDA